MKEWTLKFTMMDNGEIQVMSRNDGFDDSLQLIALLEMKKWDVMAQISPDATFKRVFVDADGNEKELVEEQQDA